MNWKQARISQLLEIIYNDTECNPRYKLEAVEEYKRRTNPAPKLQYQIKIQRKRA